MSFLFKKLTASAVVISMLSSCAVVVPTLSETNTFERCDVFTKKVELDIVSSKISPLHCSDKMCVAFLVVSAGVFATSAIISSSIYLVGNTVYYLEKEARCNDRSIIDKKVVEFLAIWSPIASDLRNVLVAHKISSILERIGDYSKNISRRSLIIIEDTLYIYNSHVPIPAVSRLTLTNVHIYYFFARLLEKWRRERVL